MELGNFVKTAIVEIQNGIDRAEDELGREVKLAKNSQDAKTINFSVSVIAAESAGKSNGGKISGSIKVLGLAVGGEGQYEKIKAEYNNKTEASNISFGVYVSTETKKKEEENREELKKISNR